jgi:hypothetical protein
MITRADVEKLLSAQAPGPSVLSLCLWVPLDVTALRELPARADELFALAARPAPGIPGGIRVREEDRQTVRELLAGRARHWLGHTVAIFVSAQLGLAEAVPIAARLQERAVIAVRPHVRPLLLAMQRGPAYRVAVVDRRHAWLLRVSGEQISSTTLPPAEAMRSRGFGGWYGLQAYRVNERMIQLTRQHFRATAALLDQAARAGGPEPLVIGGHQETIPQFVAMLSPALRDQFAGSFVADPHNLTPAKVRGLAEQVIRDWTGHEERRLVTQFRGKPPGALVVTGLAACLAAASQRAIAFALVPAGGLVPGYACRRCGTLSSTGQACVHGSAAAAAVPDLIEEIAVTTLAGGGEVAAVPDPPGGVAARLRFALAGAG